MQLEVKHFFHKSTNTLSYVVYFPQHPECLIIDSALDFNPSNGKVAFDFLKEIQQFIFEKKLKPILAIDTHVHADHLSGLYYLKNSPQFFPSIKTAICKHITEVQEEFQRTFNLTNFLTDGSQFDILLDDFHPLTVGPFTIKTLCTPGHTPACSSLLIEDCLFTGDALFMPDSGTGRCDFPRGNAKTLFHSIKDKIYALPESTRIFVGHDYQPGGRELKFETTVGEEKASNIHLKAQTEEQQFVTFRTDRDKTLDNPKLLYQSIQVNINGGKIPEAESNGISYLKFPLVVPAGL